MFIAKADLHLSPLKIWRLQQLSLLQFKMTKWITLILFLCLTNRSSSSSLNGEIKLIRELLLRIFDTYDASMKELKLEIEYLAQRIDKLEEKCNDKDSHHTTIPPDEMIETFSKTLAPRSCHEWLQKGARSSGYYFIDPDGPDNGLDPVRIFCEMDTGNTRVGHNSEVRQEISGCQEAGCFVHRVNYEMPLKQMLHLIDTSRNCSQYFKFNCLGAKMNVNGSSMSWWSDHSHQRHFYWHGGQSEASRPTSMCRCGSTETCSDPLLLCNCDSGNMSQWLSDQGYIGNKSHLPVMQLNFGAVNAEIGQMASFELGPLVCSGQSEEIKSLQRAPRSCKEVRAQGETKTGFHFVKEPGDKYPKVVFCDLDKRSTEVGFERVYGSPANLGYFAAFDVTLDDPFDDDYRYINFTKAVVNKGGKFNLRDGIYIVPYTGLYLFSLHVKPRQGQPLRIQLHRNGRSVADISNGGTGSSMAGQSILLEAAENDEIRLFNFGGDIGLVSEDNNPSKYRRRYGDQSMSNLHFIGVLLWSSDRA